MTTHGLVLRGGLVIDPELGTDAVFDVAIDDGRITAIDGTPRRLRTGHRSTTASPSRGRPRACT